MIMMGRDSPGTSVMAGLVAPRRMSAAGTAISAPRSLKMASIATVCALVLAYPIAYVLTVAGGKLRGLILLARPGRPANAGRRPWE